MKLELGDVLRAQLYYQRHYRYPSLSSLQLAFSSDFIAHSPLQMQGVLLGLVVGHRHRI